MRYLKIHAPVAGFISDLMDDSVSASPPATPPGGVGCCALRRTPPKPTQEIYYESRGKCCKKLLRYNGYPNKVQNL